MSYLVAHNCVNGRQVTGHEGRELVFCLVIKIMLMELLQNVCVTSICRFEVLHGSCSRFDTVRDKTAYSSLQIPVPEAISLSSSFRITKLALF